MLSAMSPLQPFHLPHAACFIALICGIELWSDSTAVAVYRPRGGSTSMVDRVIYTLIY